MLVHDSELRSLQGLRSSLYNPLISRGFSLPHLPVFKEQERERGGSSHLAHGHSKQDERLHAWHQSHYHRLDRLTGGDVLMGAFMVAKHKDGCCEIASFFFSAQDGCNVCACMSVCARVRACVHACAFEPSAATELDRLKPFTFHRV